MKKTKHGVRCEKIGNIKTSERLPKLIKDSHYMNPHIVFDGKYYYITFSIEIKIEPKVNTSSKIIGIDLGIKSFAVCSDGTIYKNINKTHTLKKINNKLRRLQRCVNKKYLKNKINNKFIKTKNIIKLEHKIKLTYRRIKNIRENYIHQITTFLYYKSKCLHVRNVCIENNFFYFLHYNISCIQSKIKNYKRYIY